MFQMLLRPAFAATFFLASTVVAGCDLGKVCEPNQLQCSPLKNRIEQCNADGTAVETVGQCPGNKCIEQGGTAACESTIETVCTPNTRFCSPLKNRIELCNADGTAFSTETQCPGNSCVEANGTAACEGVVEPTCSANSRRCSESDPKVVEQCRTTGDGWFSQAPCSGALVCVESGGSAACQACAPGTTRCGSSNASVETCNAAGTGFELTNTCLANSCGPSGGSFACELPCEPGATKCGVSNGSVQSCNAAGDAFELSATCLQSSCRVGGDGAFCQQPLVCTANSTRCSLADPRVVEQCRTTSDGWFSQAPCAGSLLCTAASGTARCQTCVPGTTRCGSNNASVEVCNAEGTGFASAGACTSNSCKFIGNAFACEFPCTPGETRCGLANQTVQACEASGTAYAVAERCLNQSCTTAFGPATCAQPEVCTPGTRRCSATAANQVEQCNTSASGWFLQTTCAGQLRCIGSGTCQSCVPGSRICGANNASVQVCNESGTGFTLADACSSNSCQATNGTVACVFPCSPGATRCAWNRSSIEVCSASGLSYTAGEACFNSSCGTNDGVPTCNAQPVCATGDRRCNTANPGAIEQCRTTQDGWYTESRCGGGLLCSNESGQPACQVCVPGAKRCGATSGTVETCNATGGAWVASETCLANSCKLINGSPMCEFPCTPGQTRCGATNSQVQVCNAAGDAYALREACLWNSCTTSNEAAWCSSPQVCTPGARRCSVSAANQVEQCKTTGDGWFTWTTCGGGLQCTTTASGSEGCQVCKPGVRYCGANNASVMECNPTGTAFGTAESCLENSCKNQSGNISCDLPCVPGARKCSPLRNRVDACNDTGTAWVAATTCSGNTCNEAIGSAFCEEPPAECVSGESRCSPLGTQVQECTAEGRFAAVAACSAGDCQVVNGVAACAAPVCQPNIRFCADDGNVHYCTSNGKDGGVQRTCGVDDTCMVLDGAAQCIPPELAMSCEPGIQFCGDDGVIYYCNSQGQVSGIRSECSEDQVCVFDANAPLCLDGYYEEGPSGEITCVVTAPSACVIIPRAFTTRGYVYAETEKTSCENEGRVTRECAERMECIDGRCTSSVLDETSPWYGYSCPLVQHLAYRTSLEADCRCFTNNSPVSGVPICGRPYDRGVAGVRVGTGPRVFGLPNGHIMGGFVDGDELIVAAYWGSSTAQRGAILAIHVDSGDRRLVSGDLDSVTAGSGPALSYALDVRKGIDGNYYAFTQSLTPAAPSIYRIVPATGARTLVWRGQAAGFGQCAAGDPNATASVQYTNNGFATDTNGNFLVGYANPIRDGRGLVRIAANGSTCNYVAATGLRADGLTRGTGPDLGGFVQGFMVDGGKVIVQITQPKALIEVDLATGNRVVLTSSGTAGSIGERWAVKDSARGVIWTAGLMNSVTLVAYDRVRNLAMNVFAHCSTVEFPWYPLCPGAGPVKINSLNYGGIWLHPRNGNLLMAQDSVSIIEFEPATANSVIRSL